MRLGQLAVAPAQDIRAPGSACPNGRSRLWPSPAPNPSLDTVKFCTRSSCATCVLLLWLLTLMRLLTPLKVIAATPMTAPGAGRRSRASAGAGGTYPSPACGYAIFRRPREWPEPCRL